MVQKLDDADNFATEKRTVEISTNKIRKFALKQKKIYSCMNLARWIYYINAKNKRRLSIDIYSHL